LPSQHREREIPTQFLAYIDQSGRCGTDLGGFVERSLPVLTGLAQIDVQTVDFVALV
jgi:hypothetical protein